MVKIDKGKYEKSVSDEAWMCNTEMIIFLSVSPYFSRMQNDTRFLFSLAPVLINSLNSFHANSLP